ncbi:antibiotic biosynthesis monooxygenase [Jatrophihabitans telluris]|uniref:Antibiotic biosynthesis monooxygenase n=1 Tax=Jatrophihabitans telluris TaxID=2038343 RepID=A0ABY4R0V9_9ACTN|nr:antibiotic biosynthesis monooxygenase [Jatrophihabitans telluris]UQX89107.1 antibiotic biosynthesis monooxygenase [Jatrophihabitans telluris]
MDDPNNTSAATGSFGAILQLTAKQGRRQELLQILTNYAATLDGEPGTLLFAAAADPNDEDVVFLWEEFADGAAVQAHFEHDFFRALQLELAELLTEPAAARPLVPVVRRTNPGVAAE